MAAPVRIWFNRTFATTWHLIEMIRANPEQRPVHVISSHHDPDSPVLAASDEYFLEPTLAEGDYVEWALDFAARHQIDVLVPREHMAALADARDRFAAGGTQLACPDAGTVRLFEDKIAAYAAAAELGLPVPPHTLVTTAKELRAAYDRFVVLGEVCMKPVRGAGGEGYRRLSDAAPGYPHFAGELRSVVRVDDVCAALDTPPEASSTAPRVPLLVSPFLDGAEVSVDVLADRGGTPLTMIGRLHAAGRRRALVEDPRAFEVAHVLTTTHHVSFLSNTQVKYWRGPDDDRQRPYLLEVNTRAAGGLFQTALADVNLAWLCIRVALGEDVAPITPTFGAAYTQLAAAVGLPAPEQQAVARGRGEPNQDLHS